LYISFHFISWGVPAILTAIALFAGVIVKDNYAPWCHLQSVFEWTFWFTPMILSIGTNLCLYILIFIYFRTQLQRRNETVIFRRLSIYLLAFIMCWIWNIIDHAITHFKPGCTIYFLWILQDIFAPLQGFLNFLVYAVYGNRHLLTSCCKPRPSTPKFEDRYQIAERATLLDRKATNIQDPEDL